MWEWIKERKTELILVCLGILVVVVPLTIGFGPLGPIAGRYLAYYYQLVRQTLGTLAAGWQAEIGVVAAGSASIMQPLTLCK